MKAYTSKRKPREKQKTALEKIRGRSFFALLMAMRTGKTKVVLDDFGQLELNGEADRLLIIAPGGVYETWTGAASDDFSLDLEKRCAVFTWMSGKGKEYKTRLAFFLSSPGPKMLLMNVEAFSSVKEARETAIDFLEGAKCGAYTAIDESTIIKNPTSKRTKFINEEIAPRSKFRRILSGLIAPKSPMDLFSQFWFLDRSILGFKSFFGFRGRFAMLQPIVVGGRAIQTIVGFRDLDELYSRYEPHSFRVRLEDCYDVPKNMYLPPRYVKLTDEQDKAYREMKAYATTQLRDGSHVTATVVIAQIARLHQILCGFTVNEERKLIELPENRTKDVLQALEEYDGKAVIWCAYDYNIRRLSEALKGAYGEASVARFWGGNRTTREQEEATFKTDPSCRFMVATASAGGKGRTWSTASLTLYHSCTPDLEHRSQSEERTKAVGKEEASAYLDFMVKGSVEEKYIKMLRKKIDISSIINGDNYMEWLI